MYGRNLEDRF